MPKTTTHQPFTCFESWDAMMPTAAGRHCASCRMEVVDFTRLSEAEVLAYLAARPGQRVCARMAASVQPKHPKHLKGSRRWLLAASILLGWQPASALTLPLPQAVVPKPALSAAAGLLVIDSLTIIGILKKPNGSAANKRKVKLKGISVHDEIELQTTTDRQGRFRFTVAPDSLHQSAVLEYFYLPKFGWHFQTAGEDVDSKKPGMQTYVLQIRKRSKLVHWWSLYHPPY